MSTEPVETGAKFDASARDTDHHRARHQRTGTCDECGGLLVRDGPEVWCSDCGLVS